MTSFPERIGSAIAHVDALEDPAARAAAHEALGAVLDLHGEGLRRIVEILRGTGSKESLKAFERDEIVTSLLLVHGLHPQSGAGTERDLVPVERLTAKRTEHERCDLCGQSLASEHEHLFDIETRKLRCSCTACAILFDAPEATKRRVRKGVTHLAGFRMSDDAWRALEVPVSLAFFSYSSARNEIIAAYPGPAGAMEAVVPQAAWRRLVADNPMLAELPADTTALLVDRLRTPPSYHSVSIDECFRLTGIVRSRWEGMTGGSGARRAVEEFFSGLSEVRP